MRMRIWGRGAGANIVNNVPLGCKRMKNASIKNKILILSCQNSFSLRSSASYKSQRVVGIGRELYYSIVQSNLFDYFPPFHHVHISYVKEVKFIP
jgi:hypothetical protein